ncbi:40S ribosomal protein S22-A [Cryptococcus floricola]|uniref:40S ribosomal protein S22-A n=1 Tax=Cryptococcus floricola TaxID=2591691 RepID=A0A5D3AKC2_9TREE|nr:40S ribosomal protein S22-A [Cryptococcus floricola]
MEQEGSGTMEEIEGMESNVEMKEGRGSTQNQERRHADEILQNNIVNAERRGKRQVLIHPSSKVVVKVLSVMQKHGYIGEFEVIDDHRGGKIVIQLNGRLNKCGVISPRFNVSVDSIENWVSQLLPARSFGKIILTTSAGIMDHTEARNKHVGGKILAYVY